MIVYCSKPDGKAPLLSWSFCTRPTVPRKQLNVQRVHLLFMSLFILFFKFFLAEKGLDRFIFFFSHGCSDKLVFPKTLFCCLLLWHYLILCILTTTWILPLTSVSDFFFQVSVSSYPHVIESQHLDYCKEKTSLCSLTSSTATVTWKSMTILITEIHSEIK